GCPIKRKADFGLFIAGYTRFLGDIRPVLYVYFNPRRLRRDIGAMSTLAQYQKEAVTQEKRISEPIICCKLFDRAFTDEVA
ncbi:MAG TPA: hypothetical protein VIJ17_03875, partial [Pseudolabrys sp.]